jgi:antitoxin component of RelBE/YafQ-DinJ toxin-antitoxin module
MTTQIAFKIKEDVKKAAMRRANTEGITLSAFLKMAVKSFADGRFKLDITDNSETFNESMKREILEIDRDIKEDKNLSSSFGNAKDAIKYLKNAN